MKSRILMVLVLAVIFNQVFLYSQELPEQYREKFSDSFSIRKEQHIDLGKYTDRLVEERINKTLTFFKPDYSNIESYKKSTSKYRKKYFKTIGYPPPHEKSGEFIIKLVGEDKYSNVYRVWVEVLDGVKTYGIYVVPRNLKGKAPLIIAFHGGSGCPEAIVGIDTRKPYHNLGYEAVKRGYIVWAPELIDRVTYGGDPKIEEAHRHQVNRKAKLGGTSLEAILLHKIKCSVDALIKNRPEIDTDRIGITGLSRGGRYTLLTTASIPYIKCAVVSGMFIDHESYLKRDRSDPEKPADIDILKSFGNAEKVGMVCPRPLMVQMGVNDPVIPIKGARVEIPRAALHYQKLGIPDKFEFFEHSGGHEFHLESLFEFFEKHLK